MASDTPATAAYFAATADGPFDHQRDAYEAGYDAGREACARLAEQHRAIWLELVTSDDGVGTWEIREVADLIRARTTP